eukprot:5107736-Ditylum_brightwellii.AAC.1
MYKQQPSTKIQRRKKDHEKLKEQVAKQKKEIEDDIAYGKDTKADLGGNMVSMCVCARCPGKKYSVWYKHFVDVTTKDILNMLQQFAVKYSPKGHLDVANLLFKLLAT